MSTNHGAHAPHIVRALSDVNSSQLAAGTVVGDTTWPNVTVQLLTPFAPIAVPAREYKAGVLVRSSEKPPHTHTLSQTHV